ncbi:hypothetical protein GCM10010510_24500 [Streptomyces anandii JCM 4720]|nr:hypothetical protein GCM10010510_24500 [Streptomyces anandii JCM 4720]
MTAAAAVANAAAPRIILRIGFPLAFPLRRAQVVFGLDANTLPTAAAAVDGFPVARHDRSRETTTDQHDPPGTGNTRSAHPPRQLTRTPPVAHLCAGCESIIREGMPSR